MPYKGVDRWSGGEIRVWNSPSHIIGSEIEAHCVLYGLGGEETLVVHIKGVKHLRTSSVCVVSILD